MRPTPDPTLRALSPAARDRQRARGLLVLALVLAAACAPTLVRAAQPFIWDQDTNGLDDRVESVHLLGYSASFELGDTTLRQRIDVTRGVPGLLYGVYVRWGHTPTTVDLLKLTLLGMPVLSRIEAVPATRSLATFAQCSSAVALPGVERVEAVPLLYPGTRDAAGAIGVRDASSRIFPTVAGVAPGLQGQGVVIAFLDTGINDQPEGAYAGHEALSGRCLGGAQFVSADSLSQTPRNGSMNPADHGGQSTQSHGTHVAGIAVGEGGTGGYAKGIAPLATYVDIKVLNDSGIGVAVPEALDWCIANRQRDWGSGDPSAVGIDVVNLSLSSPDESDGRDIASELAARAVQLGMVVVASMGNDGLAGHVPSPAAGDGVLAVGAWDVSRSPAPGDDAWPSFNNTGPRATHLDDSPAEALKPDLLAPGVDVLSANGDLLTDGTRWKRLSGTSMSAAVVSGVCALLRQAVPGASPATIAEWLKTTARRPLDGAPIGSGGSDPRWRSTWGAGLVDAYAAWLEATGGAGNTQLRRLVLTNDDVNVTARIETGREVGITQVVLQRAPDQAGAPGTFAAVQTFTAAGGPSLDGPGDGTTYTHSAVVPTGERGARFWYRASCAQGGNTLVTPALAYTSPGGPRIATLQVTIVHDAYDSDLECVVRAGYPTDHGPVFELPGTSAAAATDWVDGTSLSGTQSWTFVIPIPDGPAAAFLPAGPGTPWTLSVTDAGSFTRSGRVTDLHLTWHSPGGDVESFGQPLPRQTFEGGMVQVSIPPASTLGVPPIVRGTAWVLPNPARAGSPVHLALPGDAGDQASIFDVQGREVAQLTLARVGDAREAEWRTRDARGRALPAGVYHVRARSGAAARVVLLSP
jgi:hypothetical protein